MLAPPDYDRSEIVPGVVHFGVGAFHRSHLAMYHDRLLRAGALGDLGICGVGVMPADRAMRDALQSQDHLYTLVVKHPDGTHERRRRPGPHLAARAWRASNTGVVDRSVKETRWPRQDR